MDTLLLSGGRLPECSERLFNMWYCYNGILSDPKAAINPSPPPPLPANMKMSHEPNFEILGAPIGDVIFCATQRQSGSCPSCQP